MINFMEKEHTNGLRETFMLVIGLRGKWMVLASFIGNKVTFTMVSTKMISNMVKAKWNGILTKDTEVIGHLVRNMDMVKKSKSNFEEVNLESQLRQGCGKITL